MEILLALPPLHSFVQEKAFATLDRTALNELWLNIFVTGHSKILNLIDNLILRVQRDWLAKETNFTRKFQTILPEREDWTGTSPTWPPKDVYEEIVYYTDGSETEERTGAGV